MEAPDFWEDAGKASADMKEVKDLKGIVERADRLSTSYDDILTLIEMGNEEEDESLVPEVQNEFEEFKREFEDLRITTMLTGEHDTEHAILTIHAVPVVQRAATGPVCSAVCMKNGLISVVFRSKCWIRLMAMRRGLNRSRWRYAATMRTVI